MAISLATPRHVFGASVSCFAGALAYADNQTIIYPAGSCLIAYNVDQREQRIVMGSENSRPVTALAMTTNRRFIAVAEMGIVDSETDRASIIVYDVQARQRILADRTAGMILSSLRPCICLWRCALCLNDTSYTAEVCEQVNRKRPLETRFYNFPPIQRPHYLILPTRKI